MAPREGHSQVGTLKNKKCTQASSPTVAYSGASLQPVQFNQHFLMQISAMTAQAVQTATIVSAMITRQQRRMMIQHTAMMQRCRITRMSDITAMMTTQKTGMTDTDTTQMPHIVVSISGQSVSTDAVAYTQAMSVAQTAQMAAVAAQSVTVSAHNTAVATVAAVRQTVVAVQTAVAESE